MRYECYGEITKVRYSKWAAYNAVVRMSNGHILCARYELKTEDEARAWLKSLPTVGEIYYMEGK